MLALLLAAQTFSFTVSKPAEVVAELRMSSPGADWAAPGREAAVASLRVAGKPEHHVMLWAGADERTYRVFLGAFEPGRYELAVERDGKHSAAGAQLSVAGAAFREIARGDREYDVAAHAPVLFARANTIGAFSDVPMLAYAERLDGYLQYTVVFSNEDGGTSTRALMARWGRATDIEYIYKLWPDGRATMQAKDHQEIPFRGRRFDGHPLLIPVTQNNMVADSGESAIRFQLAPALVDLSRESREAVMDADPLTYRAAAQELRREGKLRAFGTVDGQKISDPRNYLVIEAKVTNRDSAIAAVVQLRGETVWRSSALGIAGYAIERDGWVRTTIELPPGTAASQIGQIGFECSVALRQPIPVAGLCRVEAVSKVFLPDRDYRPGAPFWRMSQPVAIPTGQTVAFPLP